MNVKFYQLDGFHVAACPDPSFYIAAKTLEEVCASIPVAVAELATMKEKNPRLRIVK